MLNLYWKVFLGFWLTSLTLSSAAVFVSHEIRRQEAMELSGLTPVNLINRTAFIIRRLPDDIDDWREQLGEHDVDLYIRKRAQSPLSTPAFPADIQPLFDQLEDSLFAESGNLMRLRLGRQELAQDGSPIDFVLDMPSTQVFWARELFSNIGVQVLLAFALSGLACFVLARYLTRNLKQLSLASRALARGDMSARAQLSNLSRNDELSQLGEDFNNMADALEISQASQKRLVRDISHELRSPLARLQIALEITRQKNDSSELDRIEQEADRLNEMIGQLLSIPDDNAALEDIVDLVAMLESIVEDGRIEAEVRGVTLALQCQPGEALLAAAATQLHSALENILRNAIKYTAENTRVEIQLTQVADDRNYLKPQYRLQIEDCGPGVPAGDTERIFEPFYRVDQARNRDTGGYGIGLAIVKRIIARHGGTVRAQNTGKGLNVTVMLPAHTETVDS